MINVRLKLRFELGDIFERKAIRDMEDAGIEVFQTQAPFFDKALNISGHIDGLIRLDDVVYPMEIKSMSPLVFPRINSVEDMLRSPYPYMKAYPYQVETYMMLGKYDNSPFIIVDKSSGAYKEIWQEASLERQAEIKEKARVIDEHIKAGTTPECIPYDDNVCGKCDLVHICRPEKPAGNAIIEADSTLIEALERREDLIAAFKEYNKLDKYVKSALKGKTGVLGNFYIESKESQRKEYTVKATTSITVKIKKL
jgi:hypothetical protein